MPKTKEVFPIFQAYEFSFAGVSSAMFDLMVYDIGSHSMSDNSFGNKASIIAERTIGRIRPLHFGVNYHASPLSFKLIFGLCEQDHLDRYQMQAISMWLTGHQDYQWLTIHQPDMEYLSYRCLITDLQPISVSWIPVAFEATVQCDCPYAYGPEFRRNYEIDGETAIVFLNESSVHEYIKPTLLFTPADDADSLQIVNQDDGGRTLLLEDIPGDIDAVQIDNENGIISGLLNGVVTTRDLYGGFNGRLFRLVRGANHLVVTGNGTLTLIGRFLYNTGA